MEKLGMYVHIPFCARKCFYCDFASYPGRLGDADDYIDAVIAEMQMHRAYLDGRIIDTVFIGGGTPSVLSSGQMTRLIVGLKENADIEPVEFTIEANPESVDEEKLKAYAQAGANRLSLGLQSHDDSILAAIGRRHTHADFLKAYELAQKYTGNVNADTIFGLPGQTPENYSVTIKKLTSLGPEHISCYSLKLEKGTRLHDTFGGAEEETDRRMYHEAAAALKSAGYMHYETSNFSKQGCECRHNLKYWNAEEYLGLGAAASSYDTKTRRTNTTDLDEYIRKVKENTLPTAQEEILSEEDREQEYIMLRLRLADGIEFNEYNQRFGADFLFEYMKAVESSLQQGLATADELGIYPTLKGFDLQNNLILKFMKNM